MDGCFDWHARLCMQRVFPLPGAHLATERCQGEVEVTYTQLNHRRAPRHAAAKAGGAESNRMSSFAQDCVSGGVHSAVQFCPHLPSQNTFVKDISSFIFTQLAVNATPHPPFLCGDKMPRPH